MDLSAFDQPNQWKIPPELQAQRDAAANELRAQYNDGPPIQEEDKLVRKASQKGGKPYDATTIPPQEIDLSAFDKPMDLSAFDSRPGVLDQARQTFGEGLDSLSEVAKTRGMAKANFDVAAGTARTLIQGVPMGVVGFGEGLGNYVVGRAKQLMGDKVDMTKAITDRPMTEAITKFIDKHIGNVDPNDPAFKAPDQLLGSIFEVPIAAAREHFGPEAALVMEGLMFGIGYKAIKKKLTKETTGELPTRDADPRDKPMEFTKPEEPVKEPLTMSSEYDLSQAPPRPTETPFNSQWPHRTEDSLAPKVGNEIEFYPDNPDTMQQAHKRTQEDQAWTEHQAAKETEQKAQAADDATRMSLPEEPTPEPSQGTRPIQKITKPINNRSSRYQGGVIDPDLLGINKIGMAIGDAIRNFPKDVAESKFLERFKGTFNTTDDLIKRKNSVFLVTPSEFLKAASDRGDPKVYGYAQKLRGDGIEKVLDSPEGLRDHPTLMIGGEPGNWTVIAHNGRHRMDVFQRKNLERVPIEIAMEDGSWYTVDDFMKSKDTHITSEKGTKIPKPESLSQAFDKERLPKVGEQVRLANGNSGKVTAVTDNAVQVKTDVGIESTHPSGIMYKMNPLGSKQGGAVDLSWLFRNRKTKMKDDLEHRQGTDLRDWETFKKDYEITDALRPGDDLGQLTSFFNVAPVIGQLSWNKLTGRILKNVINRSQEIDNYATKHYKAMIQTLEPIAKLNRPSRKKVIQAAIDFDGMNNDMLTKAGLMWPDDTMLQGKGLSPEEIHAYKEQTKGIDYAYDLIDESFKQNGLEAPDRIPGYFPHFWTGQYRVMISDKTGGMVKQQAYSTKLGALHGAKVAEGLGMNAEVINPSAHVDSRAMVSTIVDALQVWKNQKGLNKPLMDKLLKFDELSKRGIIKEALERDGVTGHEAEQGFNNNYAHNNRLLDAYRAHMEASSQFWANAKIAHEVYGPIVRDGKLFENVPTFNKTLENFIGRATGQASNHIAAVDTALRGVSMGLGLAPTALSATGRWLGGYMTYVKLVVPNPGFLASQVIQPLMSMSDIFRVHRERGASGAKQGNPVEAWGTMLKEFVAWEQGSGSPDTKAALKWAWDNNKIDVYSADHVNPFGNNNPVYHTQKIGMEYFPRKIEERGRMASFLMNYNYFKKVMPKEEAYRAAAHETDINMGNYQRMNSASMYTDYGLLGQMTRPFGLIRNAYLGKAAMYVMTAAEGIKKGRPGDAMPLAMMLGTYLAVAGATGMFGFVEWDAFARMYNSLFNPETPMKRPGEFLREHGVNDSLIYGSLGNSVNLNIGPSLAAPAMTEMTGIPAIDAGANFLQLMVEGYKEASGGGANFTNVYKAARGIAPPLAIPMLENYVADKTGANPQASRLHGGVNRTPEEDMMFRLTGKRTISETDRRDVDSMVRMNEVTNRTWKASQISKIVDAMQGIHGDQSELIRKALEAKRGFDADTLSESIDKEIERRALEQRTRELMDIANSTNAADQARRIGYRQQLERN